MFKIITRTTFIVCGSYGSYKLTQHHIFNNHESYKYFCDRVPKFIENTRLYDEFMETGSYNYLIKFNKMDDDYVVDYYAFLNIIKSHNTKKKILDYVKHIKSNDKRVDLIVLMPYLFSLFEKESHDEIIELLINKKLSEDEQMHLFTCMGQLHNVVLKSNQVNKLFKDLSLGTYTSLEDDENKDNIKTIITKYDPSTKLNPGKLDHTYIRYVSIKDNPDVELQEPYVYLRFHNNNITCKLFPKALAETSGLIFNDPIKLDYDE